MYNIPAPVFFSTTEEPLRAPFHTRPGCPRDYCPRPPTAKLSLSVLKKHNMKEAGGPEALT